jgi:hypothetical protein
MKTVKLKEESYNKLVNEISHGLVDRASTRSDNLFWDLEVKFDDFYDAIRYESDDTNPYIRQIRQYADAIADIFMKKSNQRRNFDSELSKFDYNKFYDDAEKPEEWEEDYDNLDLRMLQDKYPNDNSNMRFNGQHLVKR